MSMAGEMLGEKNQEKLFSIILKREENQTCADCPTKAPTWVSLDFGVFVCMNCSGAHRHLSRNFTRVYSTKIDSWNKSNFQIMDHVGNEIANSYWEFKKPTKRIAFNALPEERVRFVNDKYIRKMYSNPKSQNPVLTFIQKREMGILERPYQNKEHVATPQVNCVGEKEFISNGASNLEHEKLRKELKINAEKKFNSVNYAKTCVDLLDMDEPSAPSAITKTQPQHASNFKSEAALAPKPPLPQQKKSIPKEDDIYSQFISAPSISQASTSTNLLDMYSKTPESSSNKQSTSNTYSLGSSQQTSMNFTTPQLYQNQPQTNNTMVYQQQQQPNLYQQFPQAPQQQQQMQSAQSSNFQQLSQQQNQSQQKNVDLMSLYNQNSSTTNGVSSQNGNLYQTQQQQQPQQQYQQSNPVNAVNKDRFQALNQMNSYGTAYYPYYNQNQQNMGFYQQGAPQVGYQGQQWR